VLVVADPVKAIRITYIGAERGNHRPDHEVTSRRHLW